MLKAIQDKVSSLIKVTTQLWVLEAISTMTGHTMFTIKIQQLITKTSTEMIFL